MHEQLDQSGPDNIDEQTHACMKLWAAKFYIHLYDYVAWRRGGRSVEKLRGKGKAAERWFESQDEDPATFVWTCHIFNLDPDRIRWKVLDGWRGIVPNMLRQLPGRTQIIFEDLSDEQPTS